MSRSEVQTAKGAQGNSLPFLETLCQNDGNCNLITFLAVDEVLGEFGHTNGLIAKPLEVYFQKCIMAICLPSER